MSSNVPQVITLRELWTLMVACGCCYGCKAQVPALQGWQISGLIC